VGEQEEDGVVGGQEEGEEDEQAKEMSYCFFLTSKIRRN
jgi:hypothetical protein